MDIRLIIREELEKIMSPKTSEEVFDRDISYIKGFKLLKKESKNNSDIWVFEHRTKDYFIRFYLHKNKSSREWTGKIFVYWKEYSPDFTSAKGKDFEYAFGPFNSYKEMIFNLNNKLKNNPLFSKEIYLDDTETQFDNDSIEMLKRLISIKDKLYKVKDKKFNKLKKIYNKIHNFKDDVQFKEFLNKEYPKEEDKQTLLIILQEIHQIDFYLHKEDLEGLF